MGSALALGMVLTFATVANACGNPAGRSKFEFTPAPYIVQPGINGTPWPIMEYEGQPVRADEVLLVVNADRLESIRSELIDLGFQVTQTSTPVLGMANLVVEVPLGSVAAAIEATRSIDGVIDAGPNGFKQLLDAYRAR